MQNIRRRRTVKERRPIKSGLIIELQINCNKIIGFKTSARTVFDGQYRFMLLYGCRFGSVAQMRWIEFFAAFLRAKKEGWISHA
jgi:hypothetical protein